MLMEMEILIDLNRKMKPVVGTRGPTFNHFIFKVVNIYLIINIYIFVCKG